ncbi:hypothetical protein SBA4_3810010 [Candidatus Sulfopaludibacter sp. SbA4]|nr:hypothetical protein SBA4_3810010 [Candidatus Sulfopaludibacter sp. SbA4]
MDKQFPPRGLPDAELTRGQASFHDQLALPTDTGLKPGIQFRIGNYAALLDAGLSHIYYHQYPRWRAKSIARSTLRHPKP